MVSLPADGFYNSYEEIANSVTVGSGVKPGYIRYKNLNNDDKIDNDDRAVCGNLTPSITYAFNFSLGWKGLELSAQFQGVADVKTYLSGNLAAPFWNGAGVLKEWATDAWTPENHNSRLPILHTATGAPRCTTTRTRSGSTMRRTCAASSCNSRTPSPRGGFRSSE